MPHSMLKQNYLRNLLIRIVTVVVLIISKLLFWKKKKQFWLIGCGSERWGDNADAFWQYLTANHSEINALAVAKNGFLFDKDNKKWIRRNTLKNYIIVALADVMATTHSLSDIGPESIVSLSKAKKVWLQHGVIAIGKINAAGAKLGFYDMICASSYKEKEVMVKEVGIRPEVISVTGLARHDLLIEKIKEENQREGILYIPTSRGWLNRSELEFYEDLLLSWTEKIAEVQRKIKINLWIHPGWHKYGLGELGSACEGFDRFDFSIDPQQLICESKLFITDYSSVFFDAALSGIPTIFFQPDRQEFIENKGILQDFLDQDILLIVQDKLELLFHIEMILNNSDYYQERLQKDQSWARQYVETFDSNACQRIFQNILELQKQENR